MSKRVTTQTEIKDRAIALDAFKASGTNFREITGDTFEVRAGHSHGVLDLRTGQIEGDDMSFRKDDFTNLVQHYGEQKYMTELRRIGASIHSREVDRDGNIILTYQTG
jgi:hypothetical protein